MERIALSKEIHMSRIIYGMWRLKDDYNLSHEHVQKKINLCIEQGITSFDQADIYGDYSAEEILGETLRKDKSLRNHMEIITNLRIVATGSSRETEQGGWDFVFQFQIKSLAFRYSLCFQFFFSF